MEQSAIIQRFIRIRDVMRLTGLSRASVYRLSSSGQFPRPVKLSERSSAWSRQECEDWIDRKLAEREPAL